jgi:hypothetical protein
MIFCQMQQRFEWLLNWHKKIRKRSLCLKQSSKKNYKVLEMSREREEKSKQKIKNMQTEIKHLQAINE